LAIRIGAEVRDGLPNRQQPTFCYIGEGLVSDRPGLTAFFVSTSKSLIDIWNTISKNIIIADQLYAWALRL